MLLDNVSSRKVLPLEIWKEISLLLPYNHLSLSTSLQEIYKEDWFKLKLNLKYPNVVGENY